MFHRFVGSKAKTSAAMINNSVDNMIESKYPGSSMNGYKVSITRRLEGGSVYAWGLEIKDANDVLVERLVVNLVDPTSEKYYLNDVSDIVKITIAGGQDPTELISEDVTLTFTGGDDGVKTATEVAAEISKEGALDCLTDPYTYDFDVITSAGFSLTAPTEAEGVNPVDAALVKVAEARGNSMYLVDGTPEISAEDFYTYCEKFNTSYAAGIGPWGYAKFLSNGATSLLPGSYSFLVAWAKSTSEGVPLWMAPAGVKRASLGNFYVKPRYEIGKSILDMWQPDDLGYVDTYKVNPIMRAKSYGYVVYGNSTLLHSSEEGETSMLQSISTRVMANLIKREAFQISLGLQFDQMTGDLYAQFRTLMGAVLDQMKYGNAIYDYRIILNESTVSVGNLNERTLPVTIQISPTPAAEKFDIALEITRAGVTFTSDGVSLITAVDSE